MNKKNFIFLLSLFLLNLIFRVNIIIATRNHIPTNFDINLSPKNILVGSYTGGRSHLKPMLDIAAILIERGHNVIMLSSGNYTPASEYPTIKQISLGPTLSVKNTRDSARLIVQAEFDYIVLLKIFESSVQSYKSTYEIYKDTAINNNIDLFICYAMFNDACLDVAHALKKPVVGFMSFLHVIDAQTYKSDPVFRCNISLENESFLERFKNQMSIEPVYMSFRRLLRTSLVFIDTFFGLELPQALPSNVQEIGPIISKDYPPLTPELSNFMNVHERVLYIAFGGRFFTTTENNNKILQSIIEIINKNMIDGVIWALVMTSKNDFSPTLNLSNGLQVQTSSILNNEHPHIRITNFAPQFAVLNHTNTKLFFSHGGAGSIHESLFTGTPMLVLPIGGDQMGNAQKLKSAGVALTLNKFNLEVNDIITKINFLLNDKDIKKNVERMKVLAKINSKRKYRAADLIEYILHRGSSNQELKELIPADKRMGFIRGNNYDVYITLLGIVLGFIVVILRITFKIIKFFIRIISPYSDQKPKRE
ncbi:UDP-Glycosyltransferase/glycogen phosphorylase [Rhizophagus irregularis]|uniref:UDP-Glycosyltransferase/glycogen phosphorylase n=1 Tax=Rhizophagus irregularis TaxID=588596 RepID=A0A2I1GML2_9GLOM|nr:UDP-Glycosyltransferase/glycogen phosphorylase [Rhizophagus irregularis]